VFCALHDQLTSLSRHAQLTRCFSAVAELLVQPIAVESLGPMHESARQFLVDLGRKITTRSGDDREGSFLFQRISDLLHRELINSVLLYDSFVSVLCPD